MLAARTLVTLGERERERELYFSEIKCGLFELGIFIKNSEKPILI